MSTPRRPAKRCPLSPAMAANIQAIKKNWREWAHAKGVASQQHGP